MWVLLILGLPHFLKLPHELVFMGTLRVIGIAGVSFCDYNLIFKHLENLRSP